MTPWYRQPVFSTGRMFLAVVLAIVTAVEVYEVLR